MEAHLTRLNDTHSQGQYFKVKSAQENIEALLRTDYSNILPYNVRSHSDVQAAIDEFTAVFEE